ncbi:MAG TPA: nitrite reductase small subunit NirD [Nitrospiria bacterium]|jgi:NAD(P)H-dependent nitrite reductase small subunit|nr:nitrite reductase small subunit NirD [Nitrospiria bacterium]
MSDFVTVADAKDIGPGEGRVVEVQGNEVALFNLNGTFYAIDNMCVHQGGPLGEGMLEGESVICPWHSWRYNVKTGVCSTNPSMKVKTYSVKIEDGQVRVAST